MYKIDWLVFVVWSVLSGVNILWLIVLFKNIIFVGFIKIFISGSRCVCINVLIVIDKICIINFISGVKILNFVIVMINFKILVEKLLNNILKFCGVLGWINWLVFFIN